jgi:hypothetical protein
MLSRRETTETQSGQRDRGRARRRERGMGRPRSSRSRSPRDKSPNRRFRRNSTEKTTYAVPACPVCLSRKKHAIRYCRVALLWDGKTKTVCSRSDDGRIIDGKGRILCSNWNQPIGCNERSSGHIHECSGCGDKSHGAQECDRAQKTTPTDSAHR